MQLSFFLINNHSCSFSQLSKCIIFTCIPFHHNNYYNYKIIIYLKSFQSDYMLANEIYLFHNQLCLFERLIQPKISKLMY